MDRGTQGPPNLLLHYTHWARVLLDEFFSPSPWEQRQEEKPLRVTRIPCAQTLGPGRQRHDRLSLPQTLSSPTDGLLAARKVSDNNYSLCAAFVLPHGRAAPGRSTGWAPAPRTAAAAGLRDVGQHS